MDKILLTLTILVLGVIGLTSISYATNKPDLEDKPCPAGTYKIAEGICKKEPTGCPFDENSPLDECTPPAGIHCNEYWSHCDTIPPTANKEVVEPNTVQSLK